MNGTYTDCPIYDFAEDSTEFLVSIHNPATVPQRFPRLKVPFDDYNAYVFNHTSGDFSWIHSDLFCYRHMDNDRTSYKACDLFLESHIDANHFGFFKIIKDGNIVSSSDDVQEDTDEKNYVEHEDMKLLYFETVPGVGSIFEMRHAHHTHKFALNMRYYNPAT